MTRLEPTPETKTDDLDDALSDGALDRKTHAAYCNGNCWGPTPGDGNVNL